MTKHITRYPLGIDYAYRPASYFNDLDPEALIVNSILGEERRKDVQSRLASRDFDPMVWGEWLTDSSLDDSTRKQIGQVHPRFMGGEYLPQFEEDEIEIARIVTASVMQDVTSVRARRQGKRIYYRVVDEHEVTFTMNRQWSLIPLSLKELIELINRSNQRGDTMANGLVFSILDWNLHADADPDAMRNFISVSSTFYSELGCYYDVTIARYLDKFAERLNALQRTRERTQALESQKLHQTKVREIEEIFSAVRSNQASEAQWRRLIELESIAALVEKASEMSYEAVTALKQKIVDDLIRHVIFPLHHPQGACISAARRRERIGEYIKLTGDKSIGVDATQDAIKAWLIAHSYFNPMQAAADAVEKQALELSMAADKRAELASQDSTTPTPDEKT
jgi:hypothetical protein